ncbi:hypothetical protein QYF61_020210 [Mycteria americana]|uniref:Uncharacterized protein n=1 Tax=Mycteria americana TaxID=33587 RepID=A0AAN7S1D4_MYCAM|nr:hypothetical protein QYF61_020210 [Mycteria americana]
MCRNFCSPNGSVVRGKILILPSHLFTGDRARGWTPGHPWNSKHQLSPLQHEPSSGCATPMRKGSPPAMKDPQHKLEYKHSAPPESHRLERPLRSLSPTINLTRPSPPLHHVHKHLIQTSFKYLQGWQLNHFPGQPVPMLDNPFSEVKFPNIQSKPPLAQLEAISSHPITCYLGEETDPHLSTTSFQAKQPQFPQPLLIRLLLQTLHQLRCPSLDMLQHLNVSLVVRGPKLNTVFEVRPHQCRVQGHDHFPSPAGHTIFDTSQDAIGFLGRLGTLLAHIQVAVNQHPQVLFCQAAFQPLFPKPVASHGVVVAQAQDLALSLVEPHTVGPSPSIQPSLPTLKQINTPTQLGVICKLTEGARDPFIQIIDKDVKQNWPQHRALGNTTCDRPPTGVNSVHHHSLGPAIQPVLYPVKSIPVQAMSSQFLQENAKVVFIKVVIVIIVFLPLRFILLIFNLFATFICVGGATQDGCTKPPQTIGKYSKAQKQEQTNQELKDHNKQGKRENRMSQRPQDLHLAAVVHAAEGWWLLSGTQLVHTDWAVGSWAWGGLGILHLQPRGDEQGLTVLHIVLDQEIHIPPAVHEEVPSNIIWDAQSILDLLYCLVHEQLRLLWTKCVPHWHLQHCHEKLF